MARYPAEDFVDAAKAYFKEFGLSPTPDEAETNAAATKANANQLAEKLGEKHPAYTGLRRVGKLRDSIARRFIRKSVFPLAPTPRKTSEKPKAVATAKVATKAAGKSRQRTATPAPEAPAPQPEATPEPEPVAANA